MIFSHLIISFSSLFFISLLPFKEGSRRDSYFTTLTKKNSGVKANIRKNTCTLIWMSISDHFLLIVKLFIQPLLSKIDRI